MSRTAGPWKIEGPSSGIDGDAGDYAIRDNEGQIIAETFRRVAHDALRDASANAEFIVKACNAHDDLLEALRGLQRLAWGDVSGHSVAAYQEAKNTARLAIEKAEAAQA